MTVSALLLLALGARVAYVLATHTFVATHDEGSYNTLASVLARGHGWAYHNSAFRPPGYPFFLAGVYAVLGVPNHDWTDPRLVEAVVATIGVGLIGLMALQLAGRTAMLITLGIGALYIPLVLVGESLLTESLLVPLILAATNCALRSRTVTRRYPWILAAGVFSGLAALTRGNGIVVGVALALLVWTGTPRLSWRAILAPITLVLVTALTIMPWTIRNARAQHEFVPVTTEAGATLAGTYNDYSATKRYIWEPSGYHNYDTIKNDRHLTEAQQNRRFTAAVIGYIGRHPMALPAAMFWNTMRLLDLQGRRVSRMTARTDVNVELDVGGPGRGQLLARRRAGDRRLLHRRRPPHPASVLDPAVPPVAQRRAGDHRHAAIPLRTRAVRDHARGPRGPGDRRRARPRPETGAWLRRRAGHRQPPWDPDGGTPLRQPL